MSALYSRHAMPCHRRMQCDQIMDFKRSPIFSKDAQNIYHCSFYLKWCFHSTPKVAKYLGYFWKIICHLELSTIAQSGHTGCMPQTFFSSSVTYSANFLFNAAAKIHLIHQFCKILHFVGESFGFEQNICKWLEGILKSAFSSETDKMIFLGLERDPEFL